MVPCLAQGSLIGKSLHCTLYCLQEEHSVRDQAGSVCNSLPAAESITHFSPVPAPSLSQAQGLFPV